MQLTYFEAEKDHPGAEAESDESDGSPAERAVHQRRGEHLADLHEMNARQFLSKTDCAPLIADFDFCPEVRTFRTGPVEGHWEVRAQRV